MKERRQVEGEPTTGLSFDMKEADVANDIIVAASTSLAEVEKEAMSVVLEERKFVFPVYDLYFRDLVEKHDHVEGAFLEVKVDFVLADPLYNFRYKRNTGHS